MTRPDLKSLAHPEWPYAGSPHEWRGFVKGAGEYRPMTVEEIAEAETALQQFAVYQKQNFGPELP